MGVCVVGTTTAATTTTTLAATTVRPTTATPSILSLNTTSSSSTFWGFPNQLTAIAVIMSLGALLICCGLCAWFMRIPGEVGGESSVRADSIEGITSERRPFVPIFKNLEDVEM